MILLRMRTKRSPDEVKEALLIQKAALTDSCAAFDAGKTWEALRLATSVYVLVHDGGKKNRSVLTQLGIRDSMQFLCSGLEIDPQNLISSNPLTMMQIGVGQDAFLPKLDNIAEQERWMSFGEWWTRDAIFSSGSGKNLVFRKGLVFNLRSKDGGSHFDEDLGDEDYLLMVQGGGWMWHVDGAPPRQLMGLQFASMRQVAHELLKSLKRVGL